MADDRGRAPNRRAAIGSGVIGSGAIGTGAIESGVIDYAAGGLLAHPQSVHRQRLTFRVVNRRDAPGYEPGLPLHRGPHRDYNAMVIERVGQIEAHWSTRRPLAPEVALAEALEGLRQLQHNLRRQLLDQHHRLTLNRRDPFRSEVDFSELDAMADLLWPATEPVD